MESFESLNHFTHVLCAALRLRTSSSVVEAAQDVGKLRLLKNMSLVDENGVEKLESELSSVQK